MVRTSIKTPFDSGDGPVLVLADALYYCSTAGQEQAMRAQHVVGFTPSPGTGTGFPSCFDCATVEFECSDNSRAQLVIPAPLEAIFKVDTETVDPANVHIADLIVLALDAPLRSGTGFDAVRYSRGWRWRASRNP